MLALVLVCRPQSTSRLKQVVPGALGQGIKWVSVAVLAGDEDDAEFRVIIPGYIV
jgi:hypothetical protein